MINAARLDEFRLCYVRYQRMWFADRPIEELRGDDWNDAPYEHNAGDPYAWLNDRDDIVNFQYLMYAGRVYETPAEKSWSGNSQYSVDSINRGDTAWLSGIEWNSNSKAKPVMAGMTLPECVRIMRDAGEDVFIPLAIWDELKLYDEFEPLLMSGDIR